MPRIKGTKGESIRSGFISRACEEKKDDILDL